MHGGEKDCDLGSKKPKFKNSVKWGILLLVMVLSMSFVACGIEKKINVNTDKNSSNIEAKNEEFKAALGREVSNEELDMFRKLLLVKDTITEKYYGEIDENVLLEGAVKGMASSLGDPYTSYLNEKEWERLNQQTEGSYVGIGVQVGVMEGGVVIVTAFDKSPADRAGILSGDVIVKVNGEEIGSDIDKAVGMMKGTKGKEIKLTIDRKNKGLFDVDLVAEEIELITVESEMIDSEVGYIRITNFDEHTGKNFTDKLAQLKKEGAKGLILDLRDNPGGLVNTCVEVASNFIEKGECVVYTVDKDGNKEIRNSEGGNSYDMPVVILTNSYTASASEIITGALKDYGKATIIGEKTFGKGIVQQVFYHEKQGFGDGTALKVTVSSYYTPKGNDIHKKGIEPDIEVKYPEELLEKPYERETDPQFKEALKVIKDKVK